jgi:hypothetical protein
VKQETLNLISQTLSSCLILGVHRKNKRTIATAQCHCGKVFETHLSRLKNGSTKSCGCLQKACVKTHDLTKHKHFNKARTAFARCNNTKHPKYKDYGKRGIECRFKNVPELVNYLDKMPGWFPGATVDRINNDGHYEPGNLRWSTAVNQRTNQRMRNNNKSGIQGVSWVPGRNDWRASFSREGKKYANHFSTHFAAIFWLRNKQLEVLGYTIHLGFATDINQNKTKN